MTYLFSLQIKQGLPQEGTLGRMNFLSNKSCSCSFSSLNSGNAILYGAIDIASILGTKSIQHLISLYGDN